MLCFFILDPFSSGFTIIRNATGRHHTSLPRDEFTRLHALAVDVPLRSAGACARPCATVPAMRAAGSPDRQRIDSGTRASCQPPVRRPIHAASLARHQPGPADPRPQPIAPPRRHPSLHKLPPPRRQQLTTPPPSVVNPSVPRSPGSTSTPDSTTVYSSRAPPPQQCSRTPPACWPPPWPAWRWRWRHPRTRRGRRCRRARRSLCRARGTSTPRPRRRPRRPAAGRSGRQRPTRRRASAPCCSTGPRCGRSAWRPSRAWSSPGGATSPPTPPPVPPPEV
jgi:hypothetical protein